VPTKIDEISFKLGTIESSIEALEKRAEQDRERAEQYLQLQTERHSENQEGLAQIRNHTQAAISEANKTVAEYYAKTNAQLEGISKELRDHAAAVASMRTAGSQIDAMSRSKLALLASVGLVALWIIGHAIEAGLTWLVGYLLKAKFGGG
jgi:dsDNA-specific endonuclease/ATPase MutS2